MFYDFKNKNLEAAALLHPSKYPNKEFQRLEFLGDKIISLEIAKILFRDNNLNEGGLSIRLSELVRRESQASVAHFLEDHIVFSGSVNCSILSDCLEAWIGAAFCDGADMSLLVETIWSPLLKKDFSQKSVRNLIQEMVQKNGENIEYIFEQNGDLFTSKLQVGDNFTFGYGKSKKEAAEMSAKLFLKQNYNWKE